MNLREENLSLPVSRESEVVVDGGKCTHGVYIPSNQSNRFAADYCTVCTSLTFKVGA